MIAHLINKLGNMNIVIRINEQFTIILMDTSSQMKKILLDIRVEPISNASRG